MVDNVAVTPGSGANIATDDIGGVQHQRVKSTWGPDGTANDTDVATGKPLPVQLRGSDGTDRSNLLPVSLASVPSHAVTNVGTFATQVDGAALTALQLIDDVVFVDDAVFTPGTSKVAMIGAQLDNTGTDSVDEGDAGALRMSANRNLYVNIRDNAGNERGLNIDASGQLAVTLAAAQTLTTVTTVGTVSSISSVTPGTGALNLGKVEDAVHTTGDVGVMALGVRNDAGTTLATTTGDYIPLSMDANGALRVTGGGGGTEYTEDVASAADPVGGMMMTRRRDTLSASEVSADGDNQAAQTNTRGALWVAIDASEDGGLIATGTAGTAAAEVLTVQGIASMTPILVTAQASTGTQEVVGDVAADVAVAGNPVLMGGRGSTATPTAMSADGDATHQWLDLSGAAVVTGYVAQDAAVAGKPVLAGARASTATPTAMSADGDSVFMWATREGAMVMVGAIVDDAAFTPATSRVVPIGLFADEASTDSVDEGDAGVPRMTLDRKAIVTAHPHTSGGCAIHRSIDLDEGGLEVVKASPGQVYGMWASNTATTTRFIKFYNATSGTLGTGTPVLTIPIPGNASDDITGVFNVGGMGVEFTTGICVGAGTGVADADTGAPGANEVIVNIFYK